MDDVEKHSNSANCTLDIKCLHSLIPLEEQQKALVPATTCCKVALSTIHARAHTHTHTYTHTHTHTYTHTHVHTHVHTHSHKNVHTHTHTHTHSHIVLDIKSCP